LAKNRTADAFDLLTNAQQQAQLMRAWQQA